ncbi:MAG: D-glycero-alpha-D-manno-heptose-1,7-bisphosphate 7-phosphatase [Stellaceae bacterium]
MVAGATANRAVFLDRDGVLSIPEFRDGRSFAPRHLDDFRLYEDAAECLRRLKAAGFSLIVVTNQPDVGNGLVDREVVEEMHRRLAAALPVDAIEVCYHRQADGCDCRKPLPGMLRRAAARLGIDCTRSIMVGDRESDVAAGQAMGCRTIFIDLGYRGCRPDSANYTVGSLAEATAIILGGN